MWRSHSQREKIAHEIIFGRGLYWDPSLWIRGWYRRQKIIFVGYIEGHGETGEYVYWYSTVASLAPQCDTAKIPDQNMQIL